MSLNHLVDRLRALVAAGLACLAAAPAFAGDSLPLRALDQSNYDRTRDGVLQLICQRSSDNQLYLARAAVLDLTGFGEGDILLTAGHAVIDGEDLRTCRLRGYDEAIGQVTEVLLGSDLHSEAGRFEHDWAVLRIAGRLEPEQTRLPVAAADIALTGDVTLLRRAVDVEPCEILFAHEEDLDPRLVYHSCNSRPGVSGSPMLAMVGGVPHVIGVHVGRLYYLEAPDEIYSVARLVNGELLTALHEMSTERQGN